jgi:hypothetical protein
MGNRKCSSGWSARVRRNLHGAFHGKRSRFGDKLPRHARSGQVLVALVPSEHYEMGMMNSVFRDWCYAGGAAQLGRVTCPDRRGEHLPDFAEMPYPGAGRGVASAS